MERSTTPTSGLLVTPPELSPLEQEVLDEYERLAENMKKVCSPLLSSSIHCIRPLRHLLGAAPSLPLKAFSRIRWLTNNNSWPHNSTT